MIKWIRPSGTEIETNERAETIEYCVSLGWEREGEKEVKVEPESDQEPDDEPVKRRGRPPKAQE